MVLLRKKGAVELLQTIMDHTWNIRDLIENLLIEETVKFFN